MNARDKFSYSIVIALKEKGHWSIMNINHRSESLMDYFEVIKFKLREMRKAHCQWVLLESNYKKLFKDPEEELNKYIEKKKEEIE